MRNFPRQHRFLSRNSDHMKHKITAILGVIAAFGLAQPVHAEDTAPPAKPPAGEHHSPAERFKKLDTNGDGFLSKEEFLAPADKAPDPAKARAHREELFNKLDTNKDGKISLEEFLAGAAKHGPGGPGHHHHGPGQDGDKPAGEPKPAPPAAQ